jgi:hypothetical protein
MRKFIPWLIVAASLLFLLWPAIKRALGGLIS